MFEKWFDWFAGIVSRPTPPPGPRFRGGQKVGYRREEGTVFKYHQAGYRWVYTIKNDDGNYDVLWENELRPV